MFRSLRYLTLLPLLIGPATAQTSDTPHPLSIEAMRARTYPGSALTVERTLNPGSNYRRYVVSYRSDGLKINALLTVPNGQPPKDGWPAIVFNHGYIPPNIYRTTERYVAYQDAFARAGFVTLKSDYRGHGSSQGEANGAYYSPDYTVDVLNAAASLRKDRRVNPARLGMWGHSMGGHLTLRAMVVDPGIKAGVIWAGVVAPYDLMQSGWRRGPGAETIPPRLRRRSAELIERYGTPKENPEFWRSVSPNSYLRDLKGPLQLHQGTADVEVPVTFHQALVRGLKEAGKPYQSYMYPGDDHNLSKNLRTALNRSVAFFKKHL
ncbi:dipeptidyl aminopeptidase/acylaminoacyl peptidase [Deinobacterium chartae]|uniref:Dipeptidyl aminopeptidase/acylaminoacyl peptidase n=1 Tax=Deinobacterium chartae TaxID=521158 RepID=A0A841I8M4_9DEIO|nr:alpha/beta fold hydrolase [Deinobacterium chartae]MBB6100135.1 dipeptidyl aminopeptidase/acylaminoacyl peptidase [Deinobacterium chartae]